MAYETGGWPTAYEVVPGYDKIKRVAQCLRRLSGRPDHAQLELSTHYVREHFQPNTGAAEMLDRQLYDSAMGQTVLSATMSAEITDVS